MTVRFSTTKNIDTAEATALTTHRTSPGTDHSNVVANTTELAPSLRVKVAGLAMDSVNEVSQAIGGSASDQFVPVKVIAHLEAVGGAGATGDMQITIGTSAGGTQIKGITPLTNLKDLNDHMEIGVAGLTDSIAADSTIYFKATTKDTTAGAGHLVDLYVVGEMFASGT